MTTKAFQMPAPARDADERMWSLLKKVELECGNISASQEELLAGSSFLGGGGGGAGEEPEVFSTPPEQSSQGQRGEEEDDITMCTQPFTQYSPSPSCSSPDDSPVRRKEPLKPRICTRKVRGARIRTPSPSPSPERPVKDAGDPLYKAVLMIPSAPAPTFDGDILALARQRGIF